jgi:subtilase family serine protease
MPGEWSSEVSAKTQSRFPHNSLNLVKTEIVPVEVATPSGNTSPQKTETTKTGYEVDVKVINTKNEVVEGATVTIHSEPRETTTDKDGLAHFSGIEEGTHTLQIAYGDYSGEESIVLNGDVKQFKITVTVEQKETVFSKTAIVVISVLIGVVVLLIAIIFIRKKRA